jgi:hypothetical protein
MRSLLGMTILALSLLSGCGSNGPGNPVPKDGGRPDLSQPIVPIDAGCDEDAMGVSYCIINSPGGAGTPIARQNPVSYQSCKQ